MNDIRPKTLRYAETLAKAEDAIAEALPELVNAMIDRAKQGDAKAAVYLIDRILGRTAGAQTAPADDCQLAYSDVDFEESRARADHQRKELAEYRADEEHRRKEDAWMRELGV